MLGDEARGVSPAVSPSAGRWPGVIAAEVGSGDARSLPEDSQQGQREQAGAPQELDMEGRSHPLTSQARGWNRFGRKPGVCFSYQPLAS